MHAVFKDERERIVSAELHVRLFEVGRWLRRATDAVRCEVYEDERGVRGRLVTVYVRREARGEWRPL